MYVYASVNQRRGSNVAHFISFLCSGRTLKCNSWTHHFSSMIYMPYSYTPACYSHSISTQSTFPDLTSQQTRPSLNLLALNAPLLFLHLLCPPIPRCRPPILNMAKLPSADIKVLSMGFLLILVRGASGVTGGLIPAPFPGPADRPFFGELVLEEARVRARPPRLRPPPAAVSYPQAYRQEAIQGLHTNTALGPIQDCRVTGKGAGQWHCHLINSFTYNALEFMPFSPSVLQMNITANPERPLHYNS